MRAGGTVGLRLFFSAHGADDGIVRRSGARTLHSQMIADLLLLLTLSGLVSGQEFTDDSRIPFCVVLHTPASAAAEARLGESAQRKQAGGWRRRRSLEVRVMRAEVEMPPGALELQ